MSTAEEYYKERHIRFKPQFCYIDAYTEPHPAKGWPPPGWDETREEALERMRNL